MNNYIPGYVSYIQTHNLGDIVPSPRVAKDIGTKLDAENGQAIALQIDGSSMLQGQSVASVLASIETLQTQLGIINSDYPYEPTEPTPIFADVNPLVFIGCSLQNPTTEYFQGQNETLNTIRVIYATNKALQKERDIQTQQKYLQQRSSP